MNYEITNDKGEVVGSIYLGAEVPPRVIAFDYTSGSDSRPIVLVIKDNDLHIEGLNLNYMHTTCDPENNLFSMYRRYSKNQMKNITELIER